MALFGTAIAAHLEIMSGNTVLISLSEIRRTISYAVREHDRAELIYKKATDDSYQSNVASIYRRLNDSVDAYNTSSVNVNRLLTSDLSTANRLFATFTKSLK
jgi:hypothetical protein